MDTKAIVWMGVMLMGATLLSGNSPTPPRAEAQTSQARPPASGDAKTNPIVQALFEKTLQAQRAWVNGDSAPYWQDLYAHSEDLTIFGPFGGEPLPGWAKVQPLAPGVAALFKGGTTDLELVHAMVGENLICLVMIERGELKFAGHEGVQRWVLWVTQMYQKDGEQWRVIHRHADPLIQSRPLDEVLALLTPPSAK